MYLGPEDSHIDFIAIKGTDVLDLPNSCSTITIIYFQSYTEQMCIWLVLIFESLFNNQTSESIIYFKKAYVLTIPYTQKK